jgi:predicted type IV restriction endonuclease
MEFITTIKEIITSIKQGEFRNEAEVTQGIILPILKCLNWNVFDTKKVTPQYAIDNMRIDLALCFPDNKPIVIIEVKALGKVINTDEQVLKYSFSMGIPVAILTDGQEWHFYLPAERGILTERRFYKLDLLEREPNEIIDILKGYLDFDAIKNGDAIKKAKSDYDKQYKNKEINASIPKAWEKLIQDKDNTLITLIAEKVADLCGSEPSEQTILNFLINLNKNAGTKESEYSQTKFVAEPSMQNPIQNGFRGVIFNNNIFETSRNGIGTLESLLKLTITKFPKSLSRIERETKGRSRLLISKHKSELYNNRPHLIEGFTKELPNGWWLGSNYGKREIEHFCSTIETCIQQEYGNQNIKWVL